MAQAKSVVDTIARCFDNGTYSDLTIKCHYRSWKVHRVVVCSQSTVLHAACMTGFKVIIQERSSFSSKSDPTQEQYTGVIDLDDDDPVAVEILLKYFYTGKYNEPIDEMKELRQQLQVQVLTYNLADKYDVLALMGLAAKRFKSTLNDGPTTVEYLSVISDVYAIPTSTNSLRVTATEHARANFRDMIQSDDSEVLRTTLQDIPEFAFDVLQLFANAPLIGRCYTCGPNQSAEPLQARCIKCSRGGISLTHY
ncbi:hypothetical protein LHYA1_G006306 [Lachnellula hyalina]|uniref:BTB domain-containing protein n=1 Tax=Lachnellula hyalina TaxID=1316788 RepID=A0A8H8R0C8_9HELO|nr:uncharacterized protein LHYA1_G006306 [Lachnellula hyalina]TVY24589.1 hypothetical protein LHYA1_G006306 [Lachnellula hyalina]